MSNLNKKRTPARAKTTVNHGGEKSYVYSDKEALTAMATTSLVSDNYYTKAEDTLNELRDVLSRLSNSDPEFVLKTAAFARKEMNMRSFPQVILAEASHDPKLKKFVRKYADLIMSRADEPADVLAYYMDTFGKPLPNSLKRAIARRLEKFTPYQLAKYQRSKSAVSMADVIKLTHPRLDEIGKQILEGTAKADTWESKLSATGGEGKAEAWAEMVPQMGYMALLRNLCNFVKESVDRDTMRTVCTRLTDEKEVANSKQFPFRFYAAYRELEKLDGRGNDSGYYLRSYSSGNNLSSYQKGLVNDLLEALERAMDLSIKNVTIEGDTLFLVDSSGSMHAHLSDKSSMMYVDVSLLLGIAGVRRSDSSELWTFDSDFTKRRVRRSTSVLDQMTNLRKELHGGATILAKPLGELVRTKQKFDNVVVLTDMQVYGTDAGYYADGSGAEANWAKYSKLFPDSKLYLINLSSYNKGTAIKRSGNVTWVSGWTEKVLGLIGGTGHGMVEEIEQWDPFVRG